MWISRRGEPAEEPPSPEQLQQWRRRVSVPENEFPASVGVTALLGQTPDTAVGITQVEAFSTGFEFTLVVRVRQLRPSLARGGLLMLLSPHQHLGTDIPVQDRLLLGIEYPDGRRASTLNDIRLQMPGSVTDDDLVLVQHGGSGGERGANQTYWVSPLPPDGPVDIVLAWPGFGLDETRTALDGASIRAAASRSRTLWAPQPDTDPPEPPPPPRPTAGWFAEPPH